MTKGTEKEIRFVCIREDGTYITSRTMQHVSRVIHNDLNKKDFDYHSLRHPYVKLKLKSPPSFFLPNELFNFIQNLQIMN